MIRQLLSAAVLALSLTACSPEPGPMGEMGAMGTMGFPGKDATIAPALVIAYPTIAKYNDTTPITFVGIGDGISLDTLQTATIDFGTCNSAIPAYTYSGHNANSMTLAVQTNMGTDLLSCDVTVKPRTGAVLTMKNAFGLVP